MTGLSARAYLIFLATVLALMAAVALAGLPTLQTNTTRLLPGTDAAQYDLFARNLEANRGFSSDGPPFEPTVYREPGYPLFVAVVYRLTHDNADVVAAAQILVLALISGLVAMLGARLFSPLTGLVAGGLIGFSPELTNYASWVLSETLFTFLLVASLALAARAQRTGRGSDYLAVGVGLGLSMLVRAIAGSLVLPVGLLLAYGERRSGWRRVLLHLALLGVGAAVVVAPWLARNWAATGRPAFTSRSGVVIVRRAPRAAEPASMYPGWVRAAAWMATNPLSNLIVPIERFQWGPEIEDNAIWDFHVNESVRYMNRYDAVCRAAPSWDDCATEIGLAFFRAYPVQYLAQSAFELVKLHFAPLPSQPGTVHNVTVWLAFLGIAGVAVRRRIAAGRALVLGTVAVYVALSVLVDAQERYILPVLPIYAIFAAALPAALVEWAWRRIRGRGTREP